MTCHACDGHGLFPVRYDGHPPHFALCLCPAGEAWRCATNHGTPTNPLWHAWAAKHNIPHEQIVKLEDYATPEELAAFGFTELTTPADALSAVAAAARARKGTLR
jgi:hypothetical protein